MEPSKLKDHVFKKGKFTTPLNTIMTPLNDDDSWSYGRLPEYLWIGLVLKKYGRSVGLEKIYKIILILHELAPDLFAPRMSDVLSLESPVQASFYEQVLTIMPKDTIAPLTLLLTQSKYPVFAEFFCTPTLDIKRRQDVILETMQNLMDHQTYEATDIRFVVLYFELISGRLNILKEQGDLLREYPTLDHANEKMRMIRPMIRSMEMMSLHLEKINKEYITLFWGGISKMTDCNLFTIKFKNEDKDIATYLEQLHEVFIYLSQLFTSVNPLDEKMKVILGIATYSYKRFKEAANHNLFNSISGRGCIRVMIENYIMLKYLLKKESEHQNIWREYQYYGLGLYKLVLARHRECQDLNVTSHFDKDYIEALVNEFIIEESVDMDTRYFDQQNIRLKAEAVNEKDLFGLYYDYDSSFEHGLWGAIRESSLVKCHNPAHQYHCVPDVDDNNNLKSVLPDCIMIMRKTLMLLNELYGLPDALYEEVKNFDV
ncbi:DUF5677 domain-containing protein [Faecalispora jeddahensis]|uniref:DUF5677 domain-containing protein n=1 Tax=Faecalispora jeddahensis TaxID=1414721 RepID=UPI0004B81CAB|nr:DUF5677 domain-containing protein [Faecalispora jeddahensis]